MDFRLSPAHQMIRDTARRFVDKELPRERVLEWVRNRVEPPREVFRKLGELGLYGFLIPAEYGGGDEADPVGLAVFVEQLARASSALATIYGRAAVICGPLVAAFGTAAQKDLVLPRVARGEVVLSLALTEPDAGSDAASIQTRAERQVDGSYLVRGAKTFITQAESADFQVLAARTEADRYRGITLFLLERPGAIPNVECRRIDTLGLSIAPTYGVSYSGVALAADSVIGSAGEGWKYLLHGLDMERFYHGAITTGASQAIVDEVVTYVKQRVQFGQPLGKLQAVRHKLADMQTSVDAARLLTYRAAHALQLQGSAPREASMAKLVGAETYMRVAHDGLQLLGGYGYSVESGLPMHFADAKLFEIGGGAMEIQRNIIAKAMGL
ncbi:MAG: acyl-CoA dehydrogenase family protein [Gemmatimonadales bacterium]|nr:acyl-CoA dehydrogenase family protein [Gemmatimonadales bacterium]